MKKAIKGLIVASAVAAVVGVGAVSFAAWSGGSITSGTATGELGSITAYGFDTALTATMGEDKLMPYNQTNLGTNQVAVWSAELPTVTTTSAAKLTVKLTTDPGLDASSGIYVMYSEDAVTTAPGATTGYQKLTTDAEDLTGATFTANSQAVAGGYLVVILDSSKLGDMKKSFNITVTVEEA